MGLTGGLSDSLERIMLVTETSFSNYMMDNIMRKGAKLMRVSDYSFFD